MAQDINVELLAHSISPETIVASAAKLCYSNQADIKTLMENLDEAKVNKFIEKLMSLKHYSAFEHASFTFGIEGVSRVVTHELVRHRTGKYSQRSQRYCSEEGFNYRTPSSIKNNPEAVALYTEHMKEVEELYKKLQALGIPNEDARYVLPNATHTRIVVTFDLRNLWHFFNLRCCIRAQNEINELANKMLEICKAKFPVLFQKAGAYCIEYGYCPEGDMCCGAYPTIEELIKLQ